MRLKSYCRRNPKGIKPDATISDSVRNLLCYWSRMCEHSIRRYEHCQSYRCSPPRCGECRLTRFPPINGETGRHRGASPVTIRTISGSACDLAVSRRRASSCRLVVPDSRSFPAVSLLLNAGSIATLPSCRPKWPFVGGDGMHCPPLRKDRVRGATPARLNNGHWIAVTVTQDGQ